MLRIAIAGASGRMGKMLIEAVCNAPDMTLAAALDMGTSPAIGSDPTACLGKSSGVQVTADLQKGLQDADVLIDFTRPAATPGSGFMGSGSRRKLLYARAVRRGAR